MLGKSIFEIKKINNVKGKGMSGVIKGILEELTWPYKKLLTMWVFDRGLFRMVQLV